MIQNQILTVPISEAASLTVSYSLCIDQGMPLF